MMTNIELAPRTWQLALSRRLQDQGMSEPGAGHYEKAVTMREHRKLVDTEGRCRKKP